MTNHIEIKNKGGLHARSIHALQKEASKYKCELFIKHRNQTASLKSVLEVAGLGVQEGDFISIYSEGGDDQEEAERNVRELLTTRATVY